MPKYFITGSRVYGPARPDSDLDIMMFEKEAIKLHNLMDDIGVKIELINDGYSGFYITVKGFTKINIITTNDSHVFNQWEFATKEMKKIPPIKDRKKRIEQFVSFWHIFDKKNKYDFESTII